MSKREKKSSPPRPSKRGGRSTKSQRAKKAQGTTIATSGVPISQAAVFPRFYTNIASVAHKTHGDGIRLSGTMLVGSLNAKNAFYDVFTSTVGGNFYLYLHPYFLAATNSRFYAMAVQYQRYGFRRAKFWYVPVCSTTTAGNFAVGYYQDPVQIQNLPDSSTFTEISESGNVSIVQAWRGSAVDFTPYLDKEYLGWNDYDETLPSDVTYRQQVQGGFKFAQGATATADHQWGSLVMEYDVELYQPARFLNRALSEKKQEEVTLAHAVRERRQRISELKARESREKELADKAAALERLISEELGGDTPVVVSSQGPSTSGACGGTIKCQAHCK